MPKFLVRLTVTLVTLTVASPALASGGAIKGFLEIDPTSGDSTGFGHAVAEIADLDGDGVKDLAVGAPDDDNGNPDPDTNLGAVWILFMNADGTVKANPPPQKLLSPFTPQNGTEFGRTLAWLGDLDATHRNALAVAAPDLAQAVVVAFLSFSAGTVTATYQDVGLPPERCLPHSLAPIGDFDSDGIPGSCSGKRVRWGEPRCGVRRPAEGERHQANLHPDRAFG